MYSDVKERLHGKLWKRIANNTYLESSEYHGWDEDGYISMYLHGHCIATFFKDCIELSSCGYGTMVTKNRLNLALEIAKVPNSRIIQRNWVWYIDSDVRTRFTNGMRIDYNGNNK